MFLATAENLAEYVYELWPNDSFVRVEVVDENGKYAWSNIIRI